MTNSPLFSSFRTQFAYVGFWSLNKTKIYKLYSFFVSTLAVYFTLVFLVVTRNAKSLEDFGFTFGALLTLIVTLLKISISKSSQFQTLLSEMFEKEEVLSSKSQKTVRENYLRCTDEPFKMVNFYRMTMVLTLTSNVFISLFIYFKFRSADSSVIKPFAYTYWAPFDDQKYYFLGHVYLNIVAISVGVIVVSGDFLVLAPIFYLNCRLQTLKFVLRNPEQFFQRNISFRLNYYHVIRSCVIEHHDIVRDSKEFNSIIMYLILCDFLFHSTQIAGFLVAILANENLMSVSNLFTLACTVFIFFQLFIVYWHGQILIEVSGSITSSIYQSKWYKADIKTRKLFILMMIRSQKPLALTVGPFFIVNMELFLKISKTVYTITTIFFRSS